MPDTPIAAPSQIILVALADLRDPDWNPRPFLDEAEMPSLVDYVAAGRPVPPIEILMSPGQAGPWYVISGKRRSEAYRRAGKTHIEAIARDVPLEEAKFMAIAANRDDKPFWLGEFIAVNNLKKGVYGEQKTFAQKLGWSEKRVSLAFNLMDLLNPACRNLIFQTSGQRITIGNSLEVQDGSESPKWVFSEYIGTRLIPLWDENSPEASQARGEQAIRKVIERRLTGSQTSELVAHTLAGGDTAQFEPTAKERKARIPKAAPSQVPAHTSPLPAHLSDKVVEIGPAPTSNPAQHSHTANHAGHVPEGDSLPTHKLRETGHSHPNTGSSSMEPVQANANSSSNMELAQPNRVVRPEASQQVPNHGSRHEVSTQPSAEASPYTKVSGDGSEGKLESPSGTSPAKTPTSTTPNSSESLGGLILDSMAGITMISKIKAKRKKGEALTLGEMLYLVAHWLWESCLKTIKLTHEYIIKPGFELLKKIGKFLKWLVKKTWEISKPGLKALWQNSLFRYTCYILLIWMAWGIHENGIMYPFHFVGAEIARFLPRRHEDTPLRSSSSEGQAKENVVPPVTENQTVQATAVLPPRHQDAKKTVLVEPKKQNIVTAIQTDQTTHAWNPTDEDQNYLEAELAALPPFCVIKPFAFAPEVMGAEMANHRLADLTNKEIYSMKIEHNTQKVISVVPTSTDLTIAYQGDLVGGFLDGSLKMEIYWEDVKAIHADEINAGTTVTYQLSLVVADSKQPLIIQCASARDLEHLVAVTNYFLKAAGLASVPLASLPYLNQGLLLNNDREITALWADTPAEKAGLRLKDYLWSLETNWPSQENKTQLETGLQGFTSGPHKLYVVASAAWEKAVNENKKNNTAYGFCPPRHTVSLLIH